MRLEVGGARQRGADTHGHGAGVDELTCVGEIHAAGHEQLHAGEWREHLADVAWPQETAGKELDELDAERPGGLELGWGEGAGNRRQTNGSAALDHLGHEGGRHAGLGAGDGGCFSLLGRAHGAGQDGNARYRAQPFDGGKSVVRVERHLDDANAAPNQRFDDRIHVRHAPEDGDHALGADTIERRLRLSHASHHHMTSVVVTGSEGGIGSATVSAFEAAGFTVTGLDVDDDPSAVFGTLDRLDALVCAHGISGRSLGDGPVDACTEEAWDAVLDANLRSVFVYCKHAIPLLRAAGGGAIVTVSSVLGLVGGDEDFATSAYAASKAGVIGLTRAMAVTYAKDGIRCNVVCPGLIETPMSRRVREDARIRARLEELQPLTGGFGTPADVAGAALYLATAPFVTGAVLTVDGGWTAR